jgi:hypothetical protein
MQIKKIKTNEYLTTSDGIWVRDFTRSNSSYLDINNLASEKDYSVFLKNEIANESSRCPLIDEDQFTYSNIVIVSDGYNFEERHKILASLPKNEVLIIGVNRSLAKWKLVGANCPTDMKRSMGWYIINNPYAEAVRFVPTSHRYFPRCIASVRTNPEFIRRYEGNVSFYIPTSERNYSGPVRYAKYCVDDYRNPICAAINLAFQFKVRKLLLFCCDDSFADERPNAERLENGLYSYRPQQVSRRVIDANLFWLAKEKVKIGDYSSGIILEHGQYISDEKDILTFFQEEVK